MRTTKHGSPAGPSRSATSTSISAKKGEAGGRDRRRHAQSDHWNGSVGNGQRGSRGAAEIEARHGKDRATHGRKGKARRKSGCVQSQRSAGGSHGHSGKSQAHSADGID